MRGPLVLCIHGEFAHEALRRHGYEVIAVSSARDSLSAVADYQVDAVLLDGEAPGMNIGPLARRLKQIKPHIPVLLLSSASARIAAGQFPAADAVVMKTESPLRLLRVLHHLLNVRFPFFARWFGNWKHRASA